MSGLFKRVIGKALGGSGSAHAQHPLLQDVESLSSEQSREFVCALSVLWDEYKAEPRAGSEGDTNSHAERVLELRRAAHQVRQNGGPEKLHFALAPEVMALYLEVSGKPGRSPRDEEILLEVQQHAKRGRLIRSAGRA